MYYSNFHTMNELELCLEQKPVLEKRQCPAIDVLLPLNEEIKHEDTVTGKQIKKDEEEA